MKKKVIILFESVYSTLDSNEIFTHKLKKNFIKIVRFKENFETKSKSFFFLTPRLNKIKKYYQKIGINLNSEKIFKINLFLKKIKLQYNQEEIFVAPYFISGVINEEEFIFFELSKYYKIQFLRAELSFIKNRYILAKNLFKHFYKIKKKTYFNNNNFLKLKKNYISSLLSFSKDTSAKRKKKTNFYFYKLFLIPFKFFFKFNFNKKSKKYAIVIMGNDTKLQFMALNLKIKKFVTEFLERFNYDLIFLVHPNTNIINMLRTYIREKNIFFKSDRIIFVQKPTNLVNLIERSEFIVHKTSSMSAQMLFLDKKILCLGENVMYINFFNNLISRFNKFGFKFLHKENKLSDYNQKKNFLRNILSNSVDNNGKFELNVNKNYYSFTRKRDEKKIIVNLLNAI